MFYITTTSGMRGWFAVMIDDSDGFPEPVTSGIGSYKTQAEAEVEARQWAKAEELPFQ
jgi:hypothetical protein